MYASEPQTHLNEGERASICFALKGENLGKFLYLLSSQKIKREDNEEVEIKM